MFNCFSEGGDPHVLLALSVLKTYLTWFYQLGTSYGARTVTFKFGIQKKNWP